jgi:3-dehydroquinate synthetase
VEARAAVAVCGFPEEEHARLGHLLSELGLGEDLPETPFDRLLPYLARDKKRKDGELHLSLPLRIGAMAAPGGAFTVPVAVDLLRAAWEGRA